VWIPRSLLGLWLLAAVLPLNLRLALLLSLAGGWAREALSSLAGGADCLGVSAVFDFGASRTVSCGPSNPTPFWFVDDVVTDTGDVTVSG
jgi:hypothetical protein